MRTIHGRPTIDLATCGVALNSYGRADTRPAVACLSQEKIDRCIVDAAKSTSVLGMSGSSALAEMIEYSEAMYGDTPTGGCSGDN